VRAGGESAGRPRLLKGQLLLPLQRDGEVPTITVRVEVAHIEAIERYFVQPDTVGSTRHKIEGVTREHKIGHIHGGDRQPAAPAAFESNGGCAGPGEQGAVRPGPVGISARPAELQGWAEVLGRGGGQGGEIAADIFRGTGVLIDDDFGDHLGRDELRQRACGFALIARARIVSNSGMEPILGMCGRRRHDHFPHPALGPRGR